MIELAIYTNHNKNLCSLRLQNEDLSVESLVTRILTAMGKLDMNGYFKFEKPEYNTREIIERLRMGSEQFHDFELSTKQYNLNIYCNGSSVQNNAIQLSKAWNAYEHPSSFFHEGYLSVQKLKEVTQSKWDEIVQYPNRLFLFKSAQPDVVWIAKSENLSFNLISDELNCELIYI